MSKRFGRRQRQHLQNEMSDLSYELVREQRYSERLQNDLSEVCCRLRELQRNPYNLPEGYVVYPIKELEKLLTMHPMIVNINW